MNMKNAIISVSDKTNLDKLALFLLENKFRIYSTGGTYKFLLETMDEYHHKNIVNIHTLTEFPEILGGRVKTLHPKIYGGILVDLDKPEHQTQISQFNIPFFSLVVVNLYPFEKKNCIENIDIGGVSLMRASAKNYKHVTILCNPIHYQNYIVDYTIMNQDHRRILAQEAFRHTSEYDRLIYEFLE
jgi:phosphoribosylaminoimidazolecarboxamide formyltransferase / IMP cyclohydrolase